MSDKTGFGIDWNKAPIDATHYDVDNHLFVNFDCMHDSLRRLVPRPAAPSAWDGAGMPPAGTVCEWKEKTGFQWVAAEILFISDSSVVMRRADGFEWQMMVARTVFRPIKTAEQLAYEERERAIDEMFKIIDNVPEGESRLAHLYDAGYRRVEPSK